jgi:PhnB protein
MQVQPYLFFDGRCEEALEFYRRALGAEVEMLMRFRDSPDPTTIPHCSRLWLTVGRCRCR